MTPLPKQYDWLNKIGTLPKTIQECIALYGTQEIVGRGSNRTILEWRDELNQNGVNISGFSDDDIAWCGLFAAIVTYRRSRVAIEVVKEPLWARNWLMYGVRSPQASLGDVLVFGRGTGGHVGFYVGEDSSCYHVFGGNQSNKVCITRVEKSRCLGVRRPPYKVAAKSVKPYVLSATGAVSANEA